MKAILTMSAVCLLVVTTSMSTQDNKAEQRVQNTASVQDLKGTCYVRDADDSKPRKLKTGDELSPGQQLSCNKGSRVTIVFRGSGMEKEIKKNPPEWYVIPNIPPRRLSEGGKSIRAGRAKGNGNQNDNHDHHSPREVKRGGP